MGQKQILTVLFLLLVAGASGQILKVPGKCQFRFFSQRNRTRRSSASAGVKP